MDPVARTRVGMTAAQTEIVRQRAITIAQAEPMIGAAASDRATPDGVGRAVPETGIAVDPEAEVARGRPLSERTQEMGFRIGLGLVLMLMVFATYNAILRMASYC